VKHQNKIIVAACAFGVFGLSVAAWKSTAPQNTSKRNLTDEALLALIKNDVSSFQSVLDAGVDLQSMLPQVDGKTYTVSEGMAHFNRVNFMHAIHAKNKSFIKQHPSKDYDILSLSIAHNNPDMMETFFKEKPDFKLTYGSKKLGLLHLASLTCSQKLVPILHQKAGLSWDQKAKDGATPLTLAAENDCLPVLSYFKEHNADFNEKDGRGLSALSILRKKKDAALVAFAESFETRKPTSITVAEVNFYKKRKIPKDQVVDYSTMIEPEERPLAATETAEISEFAD
jgi:hypothetical protein